MEKEVFCPYLRVANCAENRILVERIRRSQKAKHSRDDTQLTIELSNPSQPAVCRLIGWTVEINSETNMPIRPDWCPKPEETTLLCTLRPVNE